MRSEPASPGLAFPDGEGALHVGLRLRRAERQLRPAVAWLLPGGDPADWLRELARWQLPGARLTLLPLPASRAVRDAAAVLVTIFGDREPAVAPRGVPYGVLAGRLFLPVDGQLAPAVDEEELRVQVMPELLVWHPGIGLIGFEAEELLRMEDVLEPRAARPASWTRAQPGPPPLPRLLSARPARPPTVQNLFSPEELEIGDRSRPPGGDAREAGGSQVKDADGGGSGDAQARDAAAGEGGVRAASKWLELQGARGLTWLTSRAPAGGGDEPTWVDRVDRWARGQVERLNDDLERRRNREVERLMRLLDEDPDSGLRFALPLNAIPDGSGGVGSGARLGEREARFDLGRLGQGGGESWAVSSIRHAALAARYRELAERELTLGRHRRAAYILAELLGDHLAAAAALRQGGHYREAAILYRDHCRRPVLAAECLAEGGLCTEAAEIYADLGLHDQAALLYERLGQRELAATHWRILVASHRRAGNPLAAAQVLEENLGAPDEALDVLASAWPESPQARACQEARFALLGRLGRHATSTELAEHLRERPGRLVTVTEVLASVATTYPDAGVRALAADGSRVVGGHALAAESVSSQSHAAILRTLAELEPEDGLWRQDLARFGREHGRGQPAGSQPARKAPLPGREQAPRSVLQVRLPRDVTWDAVAPAEGGFVAAGMSELGPVLVRSDWDGRFQRIDWRIPGALDNQTLLSVPAGDSQQIVTFLAPGGSRATARGEPVAGVPLPGQRLPASDCFPAAAHAGTPEWLPASTLAMSHGTGSSLWVLWRHGEQLVLACYDRRGNLRSHGAVPRDLTRGAGTAELPRSPLPLAVRAGSTIIAAGAELHRLDARRGFESLALPATSTHLAVTDEVPPGAEAASGYLAVSLPRGGLILRDEPGLPIVAELDPDLEKPVCLFTARRRLIVLTESRSHSFELTGDRLRPRSTFDGFPGIHAALRIPGTGRLALFTRDGAVHVYRE